MKYRNLSILLFLFQTLISFSQNNLILRKALEDLKRYDIESAENKLNSITSSPERELLLWNVNMLKYGIKDTIVTDNKTMFSSKLEEVLETIKNGDIYKNLKVPNDSLSFSYYQKAFLISKSINDTLLIQFSSNKLISHMYFRYTQTLKTIPSYIEEYRKYINNKSDLATLLFYDISVDAAINREPQISRLKKASEIAKKSGNQFITGKLYQMTGIQYNYFLKERDSAFLYYSKAAKIFQPSPYIFAEYEMFNLNSNFGLIRKDEGKYKEAIQFLNLAQNNKLPNNSYLRRKKLYSSLSKTYRAMKNYDSAFYYNDLEKTQADSLNGYKNALVIREINTKYQTAEKEKEIVQLLNTNLKTEASRVQNRNLLIGSLSLILVGSIFVFLVYKNTKRKQRIAEQEREIEIQKTEKLLKEQELTAIDAMISGQEKERQRLANELHDNLGSTLATVKLHFQHLQNSKDNSKVEHVEELYTKTNTLLDEAYQKVRTIAHEKNSGVMANQGLLPAVKKLAKKVSNRDGLHIEVQDYGLEERLDNTLEISIFRMIQELITNTIKHAEASEIHISLTNHDSLLNIIIEDNGKGFDAKILPKKEGMGLRNIEKRVEHLEGTFEIDSTIGKGTNIIINIPI